MEPGYKAFGLFTKSSKMMIEVLSYFSDKPQRASIEAQLTNFITTLLRAPCTRLRKYIFEIAKSLIIIRSTIFPGVTFRASAKDDLKKHVQIFYELLLPHIRAEDSDFMENFSDITDLHELFIKHEKIMRANLGAAKFSEIKGFLERVFALRSMQASAAKFAPELF